MVEKIREQDHHLDVYSITIDNNGVRVLSDQFPFSLVEKEEEKQGFKLIV